MPDHAILIDVSAPNRRAALTEQIRRLAAHLVGTETAARAAQAGSSHPFGWASFSLDTRLTETQEDFVSHWSLREVPSQCYAQREMVDLLRMWLLAHPDDEDLDLALAVFRTFSDASSVNSS